MNAKPMTTETSASEDIANRVRGVFALSLGEAELPEGAMELDIRNQLGIDSTELVEVVAALEKEFELSLNQTVADRWNTVGDACESIESMLVSKVQG